MTSEDPGVLQRPPADLHLADDVFLRHRTPVAAVGAVVPVVAHHEVVALLHDRRAPVVVAAELLRHVVVVQRHVVDVDAAVDDPDRVAFLRDHPLDEHLLGIERVVEHHDVAGPRIAELVDQLVDDQPIVILERRRHAQAVDARDLKAERDDERGVDGGREQRLDAAHEVLPAAAPAAHQRLSRGCGRHGARIDRTGTRVISDRRGRRRIRLGSAGFGGRLRGHREAIRIGKSDRPSFEKPRIPPKRRPFRALTVINRPERAGSTVLYSTPRLALRWVPALAANGISPGNSGRSATGCCVCRGPRHGGCE